MSLYAHTRLLPHCRCVPGSKERRTQRGGQRVAATFVCRRRVSQIREGLCFSASGNQTVPVYIFRGRPTLHHPHPTLIRLFRFLRRFPPLLPARLCILYLFFYLLYLFTVLQPSFGIPSSITFLGEGECFWIGFIMSPFYFYVGLGGVLGNCSLGSRSTFGSGEL